MEIMTSRGAPFPLYVEKARRRCQLVSEKTLIMICKINAASSDDPEDRSRISVAAVSVSGVPLNGVMPMSSCSRTGQEV